jgi:hypothetical protein
VANFRYCLLSRYFLVRIFPLNTVYLLLLVQYDKQTAPEKLDLLKGQLMESGITTDTLKVLFFSSCELFDCSQSSNSSKSLFVV